MHTRTPAVAGQFYPADQKALEEALRGFVNESEAPLRARGIVVPHAGYVYSGHVAGAVYSRLQLPDRYIILCPNHTGRGTPLSIMCGGAWQTPLGDVTVDSPVAELLCSLDPELREDRSAHEFEHALEVQLPFLQFLVESEIRFVPITVGTSDIGSLRRLGNAMAETIEKTGEEVLIVASSDMNHYESDALTRIKDRKAIDQLLARDGEGLHEVVTREQISMCGFAPATSMLIAANQLGATQAELVKYATSGDIFGDRERVVGYAGVVIS